MGMFRWASGFAARVGSRHAPALLGAAAAGFGTAPTVLHMLVLLAFLCARLAGIRTQLAELGRPFTATRHEESGGAAKLRTFEIEGDAAREHLHVVLVQAGRGAVFALER